MYFLYNTTTGAILQVSASPMTVGAGQAVLGPLTDNTAGAAFANPQRFLVVSGALVAQPYLVLTASVASNVATLTATLNDASSSPPASATFTVAGNTFTAALASGVATLTVDIHPSVAALAIPASVAATGVVGAQTTFGGATQPGIGLQCYTPSTGAPVVAPVGAGSLAFLRAYYSTLVNPANMAGDLATADSVALHTVLAVILPALVKAGTVTLDANQTDALNYAAASIVPYLPVTLENGAPGGTPIQPLALYAADQATAAQAFADYAADVAAIPGLE